MVGNPHYQAGTIAAHPTRFAGLAALPLQDPAAEYKLRIANARRIYGFEPSGPGRR